MLKKISTTLICIFLFSISHAQKISESEAKQYLEKAWTYLKTSDSVSFVGLWLPEDSVWQKNHTPAGGTYYMKGYNFLRTWLEPAISKNLDIDHVEIGETDARGTELKAYFKAREHAMMGFSLHVVSVNNRWTARGKPGYFAGSK